MNINSLLHEAPLSEVHAAKADGPGCLGFALALTAGAAVDRHVLMVTSDYACRETGMPSGGGLHEYGLDPARFLFVAARDEMQVLQAALEGARCKGLGAVVVELWGAARAYDLTASRRLALGAEASGVVVCVMRLGGDVAPSAAQRRWRVAPSLSLPLAMQAPGAPAFRLKLERDRSGLPEQTFDVEWNRALRCFVSRTGVLDAPLSRPVAPLFARRASARIERAG